MIEGTAFQLLILIAALIGLASASHFAIKSIEKIVEITGLSEASAGFIILAVLTSTPEITVAAFSVIQGNPAVSIGDILGSNVFNLGAVLGILGILGYIKICCTDLLVELTDILSIIVLIPLLLVISQYHIFEIPSQLIGVILLAGFIISTYLISKKITPPVHSNEDKKTLRQTKKIGPNSNPLDKFHSSSDICSVNSEFCLQHSHRIGSPLDSCRSENSRYWHFTS